MKVLALIPARSGSKGVKDKNIASVGGHPLLAYSIAVAKLCENIDEVIVSTDSRDYAAAATKYGAAVPFIRPKSLALDSSVDSGFFIHAMEWYENNNISLPDFVVHLRPTSPIRDSTVLRQAISFMAENPEFTALRSAHETHLTPYKMFKNAGDYMNLFWFLRMFSNLIIFLDKHLKSVLYPMGMLTYFGQVYSCLEPNFMDNR